MVTTDSTFSLVLGLTDLCIIFSLDDYEAISESAVIFPSCVETLS